MSERGDDCVYWSNVRRFINPDTDEQVVDGHDRYCELMSSGCSADIMGCDPVEREIASLQDDNRQLSRAVEVAQEQSAWLRAELARLRQRLEDIHDISEGALFQEKDVLSSLSDIYTLLQEG